VASFSAPAALLLLVVAVALNGCGTQTRNAAPAASSVSAALKGSPPALSSLHARANRLLSGGTRAFKSLLATLRGYPVVVNKWASWCGPCQSEFPVFQRVAVALGSRVAFVGLDGKDRNGAAADFLRRFPVSYPSFVDPQESIARTIQAATYYPQTIYFDRSGHQVYDHAGPYLSVGSLEQDIRRYVHG
jgi:cytochrome c biogenesis protein CcmG, thiol:disulfide interchange protein DsbE